MLKPELQILAEPFELVRQEKEVIGSLSHIYDRDFAGAVAMLTSGAIDYEAVISSRIPLDRALSDGLLSLADAPSEHLKILVQPEG